MTFGDHVTARMAVRQLCVRPEFRRSDDKPMQRRLEDVDAELRGAITWPATRLRRALQVLTNLRVGKYQRIPLLVSRP